MPFKRILVVLKSFPVPTPASTIEDAVEVAIAIKARIAAVTFAIVPRVPRSALGNVFLNLSGLVAEEHRKIAAGAQAVLTAFKQTATRHDVLEDSILEKCEPAQVPGLLTGYSRLYDLTIMPMPDGGYLSQLDSHWYAETAIFNSGRPTIILPFDRKGTRPIRFETVVVAWDHSRAAARAISDALPILQQAKQTHVLTVTNEKPLDSLPTHTGIVSQLALHGVNATFDLVDAADRNIGAVLGDYAKTCRADLLVMGAYGRSRFREFLLGGATKSMLTHPPLPIFLSH